MNKDNTNFIYGVLIILILIFIVFAICGSIHNFLLVVTFLEIYLVTFLILQYIFPIGRESYRRKASLNFLLPFVLLALLYQNIIELSSKYLAIISILTPIIIIAVILFIGKLSKKR